MIDRKRGAKTRSEGGCKRKRSRARELMSIMAAIGLSLMITSSAANSFAAIDAS